MVHSGRTIQAHNDLEANLSKASVICCRGERQLLEVPMGSTQRIEELAWAIGEAEETGMYFAKIGQRGTGSKTPDDMTVVRRPFKPQNSEIRAHLALADSSALLPRNEPHPGTNH
jgi:hypothetical protein